MATDIYESLEEHAKYHADNDEPNSGIINSLAEHTESENIKNTILLYSTHKDTTTIRKELNKVNINTLKDTAKYLGLPSDYKTANVITLKIVSRLNALMRCICAVCSQYYNTGDDAAMYCASCSRPCHDECYKDSLEGLKPGISLVFTCFLCTKKAVKTDTTNVKTKPATINQSAPVIKVIESYNLDFLHARYPKPSYPICDLYKQGKCPHGKKGLNEVEGHQCRFLHPKTLTEDKDDDYYEESEEETQHTRIEVCPAYKWSRCPNYDTCEFRHPPRCWKWLEKGRCSYKDDCKYHHPPLCRYSLLKKRCFKADCKFFHILNTQREKKEDEQMKNSLHSANYRNQTNHRQPNQSTQNYGQRQATNHEQYNHNPEQPRDGHRLTHNDTHDENDQSFLVNMFNELKNELKKEISGFLHQSLAHGNQHQKGYQTRQQAVETQENTQGYAANYQTQPVATQASTTAYYPNAGLAYQQTQW